MAMSWLKPISSLNRPGAVREERYEHLRPVVEPLDCRIMMSVTASFSSAGAELRIVGDDQDNVITVSRNTAGTILVNNGAVPIAGGTPTVANTTLIMMVGGAGNDKLALDQTNGRLPGAALFGGTGNDTLIGGSGNDFAEGDAGNDTVLLDAGDDTFHWNPGDGSDVVDGQTGNDTLEFNGSDLAENFEIADSGLPSHAVRFTRDVGNVVMNLSGIESIDLSALGGADSLIVNDVAATDLNTVNLDLEGSTGTGDGQSDAVILNGSEGDDFVQVSSSGSLVTVMGAALPPPDFASANAFPLVNIIGADPGIDRLTLNGLGGNDLIDAQGLAANLIWLTLNGGAGDDGISGSAGDDLISGGPGTNKIGMGDGNDTFVWNPGDGSDRIDGQAGNDTLQFNGADVAENFDLSANASALQLLRDVGNVAIDLNDVEAVNVATRGGADNVVIHNLAGVAAAPQITVDEGNDTALDTVAVEGDNNANNITIADTAIGTRVTGLASAILVTNADPGSDSLKVATFGGNDSIAVNQAGTPGSVRRVMLDGGAQTDSINILSTAPDGVVRLLPSTGDDTLNINPDGIGVANVSFNTTQRIGALNIASGGVATLTPGGANVLTMSSISVTGTGKLDVNDDALIIDYPPLSASPIAQIQSLLTSGFNHGTWAGNGIRTSLGNASTVGLGSAEASDVAAGGTFDGQPVDRTAVVVRFTLYGDADLNGAVNFADLLAVAQNFNRVNASWLHGDFNYDGRVDFADLLMLAQSFGKARAAQTI